MRVGGSGNDGEGQRMSSPQAPPDVDELRAWVDDVIVRKKGAMDEQMLVAVRDALVRLDAVREWCDEHEGQHLKQPVESGDGFTYTCLPCEVAALLAPTSDKTKGGAT